jgi:hypothetical protein
MCSELFRIPYSWDGVPIFGFGVLLAIWAVASALTLVSLVRRHVGAARRGAPSRSSCWARRSLAAAVVSDGMPIGGYGVMLLIGISAMSVWPLSCGRWGSIRAGSAGCHLGRRQRDHRHDCFTSSSIGASDLVAVCADDLRIPNFPEVGWSSTVDSSARRGICVLHAQVSVAVLALADLAAPPMIGLAFGLTTSNGCCYGSETNRP